MKPPLLCLFVFLFAINATAQQLRRSEGYFGFHFNIHAAAQDSIGASVTAAMLDSLLQLTRPDFIQVDSKGHPGIASFPTQTGHPAAFFPRDVLQIFRETTHKYGIPLVVHYWCVWDNAAVSRHSEWARVDENAQPDTRKISTAGPYLDQLMIPQLRGLSQL